MGGMNQLKTHGQMIKNKKFVEKGLKSLPKKFEMVFIVIDNSKNLFKLTIEKFMGSLLSHESRIKKEEETLEHAFKAQESFGRGRSIGRK